MIFYGFKRHLRIGIPLFLSAFYIFLSSGVYAATLSPSQLKLFREGINYTNAEASESCTANVSQQLPGNTPAAYKAIFEQAAAKFGVSPTLIAAIFVTEHGNTWPNPSGPWASSRAGASGPFQFMPAAWADYGSGGNIQNLEDSANAAAKKLKADGATTSTPIGTLQRPYDRSPKTALYVAVSYNAGPGNAERLTSPSSGIEGNGLFPESVNYAKNVYYLLTSGFTQGNPGYGNKDGTVVDNTEGATTVSNSASAMNCRASAQGSAIALAKNLAWPEKGGRGKEKVDATPAYQDALPSVHNALINDIWSDCGAFVATVMRASGTDKDYFLRGTTAQLEYARSHPEKYEVIDNVTDTGVFKPGDVIIYDANGGHTMVYLGTGVIDGYNAADASWHDHVPTAQNAYVSAEGTHIVRLK